MSFRGQVEIRRVRLTYPARPEVEVLRGLSFVIAPGEVVALVGPSGGGKSSVVKLLQRFYLPSHGQVLLDDRDVGQYDPRWLRRHVAMVGQEPVLFARSIRSNIIYGMDEEDDDGGVVDHHHHHHPHERPTLQPFPERGRGRRRRRRRPDLDEDIVRAAKDANAHDFISSLPQGYGTSCGEKGVTLSGGQKQRIAIARALVRKPRILLLDEATSALDADSESVVQAALDALMAHRGHTVLVIAHRLSTVQGADRLVVIQGGSCVEEGTHATLAGKKGGVYAGLVRKQLSSASSTALLLDA